MIHLVPIAAVEALKWYLRQPDKSRASADEARRFDEMAKALTQDIQNLAHTLQEQQNQIAFLRRQVGAAFLVLVPLLITVTYLVATHR